MYSSGRNFIEKTTIHEFTDSLPCLAYPSGLALLEVESLLGGEVVAAVVAVMVAVLLVLRVRGAAHEPVLGEQGL
jgi:hypothetical protein